MAKYQIRLNIISSEEVGEGKFYWFTDETIPQPSKDSNYGINPRHWSTTAYEIIPCVVLPKLTGKKDWELEAHDGLVFARFISNDNDVALVELCDENGFILGNWAEEDRLPEGPSLTVFTNGKTIHCSNAKEAAASVCNAIFSSCGPNHFNLPAKR